MRHETVRYMTIASDLLLITLAFVLAYLARYEWQWLRPVVFQEPYRGYLTQQILLVVLLILTFRQQKVWRRRRGEAWVDEMSRILSATASGIAIMMVIAFFFQPVPFSRLMLVWVMFFIILLLGLARLLRHWILRVFYSRGILVDDVLVIGSGEVGRGVIRTLLARPDLGYQIKGYLDDGTGENNIGSGKVPHLGSYRDFSTVLTDYPSLHTVFVALPGNMHHQTLVILRTASDHDVRTQVVPDLLQMSLNRVEFVNMSGIPMLGLRELHISRLGRVTKRIMDFAITLILAVPLVLASAVIAVAIKIDSAGPVFYSGMRVGQNGNLFKMYKFRSMVVGAEEQKYSLKEQNEVDGPIFKIKEDPRLTSVGRFLRRTSLDELPQFFNVFLGQMSLVGPRPPLPEEVDQYKPWQRQRLSVIGGITGLWQVSGRSDLTFDELCLLDIYYIENWSIALDTRILLRTIPYAFFGRGAY
jgi:exopolysaccharide biosynthesis polyprenyl glycosylphosphotransferase